MPKQAPKLSPEKSPTQAPEQSCQTQEQKKDPDLPLPFKPDFSKSNGLIAAIAQDNETKQILMLAWMNEEAFEKTLETGEAHYYSRSRKCLWHKGASSGHTQKVHALRLDCDSDALVLLIDQTGGIACHTGACSCFFREWRNGRVSSC